MDRETYLKKRPFELLQAEKETFYNQEMKRLTEHHRKTCKAYDDICNGLGQDGPYLPVALFKDLELRSVPEDKVSRQVTSSGTTGQRVSRIFLDAETSAAQQRALCMITGDFIGGRRIPMLIIDSPDVLRDRKKFSARGAGVFGFSMMASKRYYALDKDMNLDWESIEEFQEIAKEGSSFAFGFTYMIWEYFYKAIRNSGRTLDLGGCYLIHGGGWKKLQSSSVSDEVFKDGLKKVCGIEKVSDYYGMAEQTGSIFMQCQEGHLHASIYSDISILRPEDFTPCDNGEWGLVAVESLLPGSYPGHRLLTEDRGRILGEDDCPCGRKGKYFELGGRIAKAEIRGCSDTFAADDTPGRGCQDGTIQAVSSSEDIKLLAGSYPPEKKTWKIFDPKVKEFLSALSELLMKDPYYRRYPEIYALGFWCRKAHIEKLEDRQHMTGEGRGKGLVLHIAPSNMPVMFAYSWITSLMAGNSNIVRLSQRENEVGSIVLEGIRKVLNMPEFDEIRMSNAFVSFPRGHKVLEEISGRAEARIVWGGDETVRHICSIPGSDDCTDLTFPDKYSIALMDPDDIGKLGEKELRHLAHLFYNDTYGADQNACSSPKTVFWLKGREDAVYEIKDKWWNAVAEEAKNYDLQPWMATEKYRMLCRTYALHPLLDTVKRWGNRLYVIPQRKPEAELSDMQAAMGMFYECDIERIEDIYPLLGEKIQTVVSSGDNQEQIYRQIREAGCAGIDRVVSIGEALDFDTVWDRKDMIYMLSS